MTPHPIVETFAAVDLGSNSFHTIIARHRPDEELRIVDRVRERVQLAAGLDASKRLTDAAQQRALKSLERIGQNLRHMPSGRVRAVGTNALRKARNARPFLRLAEAALGHRIEIISGQEEARLIYMGVAHSAERQGRRLVIDIGGGSTECILGEQFEVLRADSLHMGCISYTRRHFAGGELKKSSLRRATIAARLELQPIERRLRTEGWDACVGASGTVRAIEEILRVNGWSENGITPGGLKKLRKKLIAAGSIDAIDIPGLKPERAPIIAGGYAILQACFDSLGVEHMSTSTGALREGVLYDLIGRSEDEDARERTIRRFVRAYDVDQAQADRVEKTALQLLERVQFAWELTHPLARELLVWAARLHELGMSVAYTSYHKHGAYLLQNSDMPGLSTDEQLMLASLVRMHRRKFPEVGRIPDLAPLGLTGILRLSVLLRLAVLLNRSRSPDPVPAFLLEASVGTMRVTFAEGYLEEHPLTAADLRVEAELLAVTGFELTVE